MARTNRVRFLLWLAPPHAALHHFHFLLNRLRGYGQPTTDLPTMLGNFEAILEEEEEEETEEGAGFYAPSVESTLEKQFARLTVTPAAKPAAGAAGDGGMSSELLARKLRQARKYISQALAMLLPAST